MSALRVVAACVLADPIFCKPAGEPACTVDEDFCGAHKRFRGRRRVLSGQEAWGRTQEGRLKLDVMNGSVVRGLAAKALPPNVSAVTLRIGGAPACGDELILGVLGVVVGRPQKFPGSFGETGSSERRENRGGAGGFVVCGSRGCGERRTAWGGELVWQPG